MKHVGNRTNCQESDNILVVGQMSEFRQNVRSQTKYQDLDEMLGFGQNDFCIVTIVYHSCFRPETNCSNNSNSINKRNSIYTEMEKAADAISANFFQLC